ncbi:MAG: AAA family ATPase, partial [Bacteroidota bacterium]
MNLDGTVNQNHYWWLTYEWDNLYLTCAECNHSKRTRFPVQGRRLNYGQNLSIEKEQVLLLDPCNPKDFIEEHFDFHEDGLIEALTEKGKITIDVLNLNRESLIKNRSFHISNVKLKLISAGLAMDKKTKSEIIGEILKMADVSSPYSAAVYHYLINSTDGELVYDKLLQANKETGLKDVNKEKARSENFTVKKERDVNYNLKSSENVHKEAFFSSTKSIHRIEIKNFKSIKTLNLDFPKAHSIEEPWMVLLGENGTGKSSVIQAIALTLSGENKANMLGLDASTFVNRNSRIKEGSVKIFLEGIKDPIELFFSRGSKKFSSNHKDSKIVILGFGSTRLMANQGEIDYDNNLINLKNLFDPYAALPNIEGWLGDSKKVGPKEFDKIAVELKKILQLPEDKLIYRRRGKDGKNELFIKIKSDLPGIRLKELSAGYQAVVTLTVNIIREVLEIWDSFSIAEGIVLVDEIGVHLHPKWKMQIISTLREIFPALTFIITTHEPLCLRGVNKGEVVLMKFDENDNVIALTDLPSPKGLTIEQLITSKFFGLITSFDPEVERQLNQYYLLKSKMNITENEKERLDELQSDLEMINVI